jgi:hypothetical protein
MARREKGSKRARHDARNWILKVVASDDGGRGLATSDIQSRAAQLSGEKIPYYSIYQGLRTLVRRRELSAQRRGRELYYRSASAAPAAPTPAEVAPVPAATASASVPALAAAGPAPMHTLAPGEITLLHVGESHVETASNVHGKLVLERHRRPK